MKNKKINKIKKIIWHLIDSNNIFFEKKIKQLLLSIKPDVIITSTIEDISSITWKISKSMGIRTIHILRSYSLLCSNANMYKESNCERQCFSCKGITLLKKINSRYVDEVVGISEFVLNRHIINGYFENAKQHVIYNMCLSNVLDVRAYNGFEKKIIKIGYLGRVHKTKGIEEIFNSVEKLPIEIKKKIHILIGGNGSEEYLSQLKKISKTKSLFVEYLGIVSAESFLDSIDLLVVPSKWNEPFGRVIIESMGRKVPVAARKIGGIPELLNENPFFLFNNDDDLTLILEQYINGTIKFDFHLENYQAINIMKQWTTLIS